MQTHYTTRKRVGAPLILSGPIQLTVHRGRLRVISGYGCLEERQEQDYDTPFTFKRVIRIGQGGTWSDHALHLLAENGVALYAVSLSGKVSYTLLPGEEPIRASLLRKQALLPGTDTGVTIAKKLIAEKLRICRETLAWVSERTTVIPGVAAYDREREPFERMVEEARRVKDVLAAEAPAAGRYFEALRGLATSFHKVERRCVDVPAHWQVWGGRYSLRTGVPRDATDPLNALLNFGYAIAAAELLIAIRGASLDPWLGILHSDQDKRANFVYDLIEPLRPRVDRLVLETVISRSFRMSHDFHLLKEGVCRLGLTLARETAQAISERLRPEVERVVMEVRKMIADAPTTPRYEPALAVAAKPKRPRVCCVCGVEVFGNRKYCDEHKPSPSEQIKARWEKWRAEGIDPSHGGEVARKRGEAIARSNRQKPRTPRFAGKPLPGGCAEEGQQPSDELTTDDPNQRD